MLRALVLTKTRFRVIRRFVSDSVQKSINNVTVIGGGVMGSGIAQVAAQANQNVTLVDISSENLQNAQNTIRKNINRYARKIYKENPEDGEKFVDECLLRINTSTDPVAASKASDLIVECIVEKMEEKHQLLKKIDKVAPDHTIFSSNTSSFTICELAKVVKRKDKFGGTHFANPPALMPLLEVIRSTETSEETHRALVGWGRSLGKTCVVCKDLPGFIANRLLAPLQFEAIRMYERGDASAEDIDMALQLAARHPLGPLRLADHLGLDVHLLCLDSWRKQSPAQELFRDIPLLRRLVEQGKLGVKTGEGFYKYDKDETRL